MTCSRLRSFSSASSPGMLVDVHEHGRLAPLAHERQLHARDVDAGLAEQVADRAHHAGLIVVVDQQRRTLGDRLEHEVVDAHDAGLVAVEERPLDQPVVMQPRTRVVIELAKSRERLVLLSITLDAALLGDHRRVHHVDAIGHALEHALQHRDRDGRDAQVGHVAGEYSISISLDGAGAQLALEAAELLREREVGADLGSSSSPETDGTLIGVAHDAVRSGSRPPARPTADGDVQLGLARCEAPRCGVQITRGWATSG